MNEFSIIDAYFKNLTPLRADVVLGPGDDAACMKVPEGHLLVVTTDTLVSGVHFLPQWPASDIANKAVMVNVSDIAAMAATPCWASVALTLPEPDDEWLKGFARGLKQAFMQFDIALIGGDLTRGPLSITITLHGTAPESDIVSRGGAKPGDLIYVTGPLGAAALAVQLMDDTAIDEPLKTALLHELNYPMPRVDFKECLRAFANSAIDISDGLTADLQHLCDSSRLGACLDAAHIPVHPLVTEYFGQEKLDLALTGGDDYQLCFTVAVNKQQAFETYLLDQRLNAYCIGWMEEKPGLRLRFADEQIEDYKPRGYSHF